MASLTKQYSLIEQVRTALKFVNINLNFLRTGSTSWPQEHL
ncbi:24849_t:CDS:2 [Gigaspora rosea]|nr:24849_t:CDS:2 [Gigaspora rosea]